jgi:hypothetical protein
MAAFVITSSFFAGCNSDPERENSGDAVILEKPFSEVEQRDLDAEDYTNFKSSAEQNIRENESLISKLRERIKTQRPERQDEFRRRIDTLEVRNNELRSKLLQYRETTKEEWEAFKREFKNDIEQLGRAVENFADDNTP